VNTLVHTLFKFDDEAILGFYAVFNYADDYPLRVECRKAYDKVLDDFVDALEPNEIETIIRSLGEFATEDLSDVPAKELRDAAKEILEEKIELSCSDGW
jgi:hypothetical protein